MVFFTARNQRESGSLSSSWVSTETLPAFRMWGLGVEDQVFWLCF